MLVRVNLFRGWAVNDEMLQRVRDLLGFQSYRAIQVTRARCNQYGRWAAKHAVGTEGEGPMDAK